MANKRTKEDWARIKEQYETGSYSLRALGDLHGMSGSAISNKARRDKWSRKYQDVVKTRSQELLDNEAEELVKSLPSVGVDITASQRHEIEVAAEIRKRVIFSHQAQLASLQGSTQTMLDKLAKAMSGEDEGVEVNIIKKGVIVGKRTSYGFLGDNESPADVLSKLAQSMAKIIPLSRAVFRIDEEQGKGDPISQLLDDINGRKGLINEQSGDLDNTNR